MVGLWVRKQVVGWTADKTQIAGNNAIADQIKSLQGQLSSQAEEIKGLKQETRDLTKEQQRQDTVIHKQQQKVTRLEVLLRQFSGLVQEHGTPVPLYMQTELDDLLTPEKTETV